MYVHTHKHTHLHAHTDTCTHTHIHVHTRKHMYKYTHANTHTHTPIKRSTLFYSLTAWYCTLGGGREHSTHSFLCFHFAQLLRSLTAPSASDRSSPEFRACSVRRPWGHTCPHHNFHLPMRAGEWKFQGLV
ncbi:unnamed protein product [Staurois parvus]|uniref:Uncharacterized protein n=1 Tax=Staurois parvus TaxID=386267 RepID=A0ABN9FFE2_9NEOB|nr:unnamed protein product [Staurois parvus]